MHDVSTEMSQFYQKFINVHENISGIYKTSSANSYGKNFVTSFNFVSSFLNCFAQEFNITLILVCKPTVLPKKKEKKSVNSINFFFTIDFMEFFICLCCYKSQKRQENRANNSPPR
uniref:Uncharacterized protein n=1 Tax=Onchocerca volvulus TaxID=6282 RepID=A0A8R1TV38_ONCVO